MMRHDPTFAEMTAYARDHHRQHMSFAAIEGHWRDPAPLNAEIEANRAEVHASIDRGMAPLNDKQAARWALAARTNGGQSNG